ncbi:hypothetical protein M409DRAFT_64117 [Zasmidium cellare ATCC 36951]|uniref:GST N-terminal domain-containing protein n=1 Tax=Zasmidium cellare ATCC 36951 TaxID=1080233 RepID=A0A6A6CVW3_ZASCE|nr:uncharacterized protein M409DRAFT_64117 [Zasmidium cellare ATCC 36951]KAF2170340.1 hypothetical protein M409DRAFT_64117 [Zasmidium cellare ATCC 36951]
MSKPLITLHWLNKSRSQRILWLLHLCKPQITHTIKLYKRDPNMTAPSELKNNHPLGKSPQIIVEAPSMQKPVVLVESGAIVEYLVDYFAKDLKPRQWVEGRDGELGGETEEGSLMSLLLTGLLVDQIRNAPVPFFVKHITRSIAGRFDNEFLIENYATYFGFLESQLESTPSSGEYLCGANLTAADIMMSFPVLVGETLVNLTKYPRLLAYVEMLAKGSEYQASVEEIEKMTGEKYVVV